MNYGFLAAVKTKFDHVSKMILGKMSNHEKSATRIILLKFIICLGCFILSSVCLMKIYEVPVYVTDINIWDGGRKADNCKNTHLTVKIDRDYSRSNKFKNDSSFIESSSGRFSHGISVCGHYYRKPDSTITTHQIYAPVLEDSVDNMIKRHLPNLNKQVYFDIGYKPVYVSISGTRRQEAFLFRNNEYNPPVEYLEPAEYSSSIGDMKIIGGFYKISEMTIDFDSFKTQNVYISSNKDSVCYVYSYLFGDAFMRPSVISTMEDVSKIVEKLRFSSFLNNNNYSNPTDSIIFEYNGYIEISESIYPKPDSISLTSIFYWDKNKIDYILKNDLVFHVNFPDMGNIQEAKIFILSMLVTMFLGMLGNIIYKLGVYKIWKNEKASYIITIIITVFILVCAFAILHNAKVNAIDFQNKIESPYKLQKK